MTLNYWLLAPEELPHRTIEISQVMQNGQLVWLGQADLDSQIISELLPQLRVLWKDLKFWILRQIQESANKSLNADASDAGAG